MGVIQKPEKVKPIFGLLYRQEDLISKALGQIEIHFSPVDYKSPPFPFVETDYYENEMGKDLIRQYISLRDLIDPTDLVQFKQMSNLFEEQLMTDGKRTVNLDPGYIGSPNLILASTKNFSHRIYIGRGIYAEVTMTYQNGDYQKLPWTYPDYYHHRDVFREIRQLFRSQKNKNVQGEENNSSFH